MSIDYIFYLSGDTPITTLRSHGFIELSRTDFAIRGTAFGEVLGIIIAQDVSDDSFTREELDFKPSSELIATIDLGRYEESIQAIATLASSLIKQHAHVKLYLNNETLLLSKSPGGVILHSGETNFREEYAKLADLPYTSK